MAVEVTMQDGVRLVGPAGHDESDNPSNGWRAPEPAAPKARPRVKGVRKALDGVADSVGPTCGHWIARRGFFYTHGFTSDKFAARCVEALNAAGITNVRVIDHGEKWRPFRGGASVSNQSHWWAVLQVMEVE